MMMMGHSFVPVMSIHIQYHPTEGDNAQVPVVESLVVVVDAVAVAADVDELKEVKYDFFSDAPEDVVAVHLQNR
jgi:hypothetical protein